MAKKTKEQISYNMSQVRSTDSKLEKIFAAELIRRGNTFGEGCSSRSAVQRWCDG